MYIVSFVTMGAASCPRSCPVANVKLGFNCATFCALISFRLLKRVLAKLPAGMGHCGAESCVDAFAAVRVTSSAPITPLIDLFLELDRRMCGYLANPMP